MLSSPIAASLLILTGVPFLSGYQHRLQGSNYCHILIHCALCHAIPRSKMWLMASSYWTRGTVLCSSKRLLSEKNCCLAPFWEGLWFGLHISSRQFTAIPFMISHTSTSKVELPKEFYELFRIIVEQWTKLRPYNVVQKCCSKICYNEHIIACLLPCQICILPVLPPKTREQ